jgi:tRNA A-37 threonylcarbamoyl transferase component Bud32
MRPTVPQHPTDTDLAAFALGKLDPPAADWVGRHLSDCPACRTAVEHAPPDRLIDLLRGAAPRLASPPAATPSLQGSATRGSLPPPAPPIAPEDVPPALRDHPKYRLIRQLGQGGMGVVYQAEHRIMERLVAVKVINRTLLDHPQAVERFNREVRAAARLDHPNIVKAYDAEQAGDLQLLAMEYVEGRSLADVLDRKGPLPVGHACHYVRQAALGLQHAHEKGMVHRDLKPHNLMLTARGVVKVLDFGLAKLASERRSRDGLTLDNAVMGTPGYMAPEQAQKTKTADIRADIYALGCTLFCLLTGRQPFTGDDALQVIVAHIQDPPPPVEGLQPEVPAGLAALVARMLAKDPAERPQTPKEVAEALLPFVKPGAKPAQQAMTLPPAAAAAPVAGDPFAGLDAEPARPAARPAPRRRWVVPAAVAAGVLVLGALATGIVLTWKTPDGIVTLDLNPPDATVEVAEGALTVRPKGANEPYTITVPKGGGKLRISKAGFTVETRDVTLSDKGTTITVKLEPVPVAPVGPDSKPVVPGVPRSDLPANEPKRDTPPPAAPAPIPADTRVYELRIYTAAPGKLDALNNRFRDHTCKLFEKHGMANVGYWVPVDNPENKFIYLLAHASREAADKSWKAFNADPEWQKARNASEVNGTLVTKVEGLFLTPTDYSPAVNLGLPGDRRIFEMRTYTATPGMLGDLHARFRDHTLKLFEKHGMTNVGYWTPMKGQPGADTTLVYMLAHNSVAVAKASFNAFRLDPAWVAAREASEKKAGGPLTVPGGVKSVYLKPTEILFRNIEMKAPPASGFVPLFNGKDLTGWEGLAGYWDVKDGAIVGAPPPGRPAHTFLCSRKSYGDFDLKFRVRVKGGQGNSGVQFRSTMVDWKDFKVIGPQCEIDGSADANYPPGSLVTEPRGEPAVRAPKDLIARVWKGADFNAMHIRCVGRHVTIRVNGETVVDADFPSMPDRGLIAWQLHGRRSPSEVTFADIEFTELDRDSPPRPSQPQPANTSQPDSPQRGGSQMKVTNDLVPLFNGKDLKGWVLLPENKGTWHVQNGELVGRGGGQSGRPAHLETARRDFVNFRLRMEVINPK